MSLILREKNGQAEGLEGVFAEVTFFQIPNRLDEGVPYEVKDSM
jgi:hypothetical protein